MAAILRAFLAIVHGGSVENFSTATKMNPRASHILAAKLASKAFQPRE
jgi:hypothetical protein